MKRSQTDFTAKAAQHRQHLAEESRLFAYAGHGGSHLHMRCYFFFFGYFLYQLVKFGKGGILIIQLICWGMQNKCYGFLEFVFGLEKSIVNSLFRRNV